MATGMWWWDQGRNLVRNGEHWYDPRELTLEGGLLKTVTNADPQRSVDVPPAKSWPFTLEEALGDSQLRQYAPSAPKLQEQLQSDRPVAIVPDNVGPGWFSRFWSFVIRRRFRLFVLSWT